MKDINEFLTEENINNIYSEYSNVFIIKYKKDAIKNNNYIGQLLLKVNIKKDKSYIKINDFVECRIDKIKWKNKSVFIVDPYWVKVYLNDEKLSIKVKVLKSKVVDGERKYLVDYEYIKMNYKQFIKRRLLEKYSNKSYSDLEAYSNFQDRRKKVGYYKALNETSKHYLIKHSVLKYIIIPEINNYLKNIKKEWNDLYTQNLKNDKAKQIISELIKTNIDNKKVLSNVVELRKTRLIPD